MARVHEPEVERPEGAHWAWVLTGIQVLALWSAGRGLWWGWSLGASVQLPWIAYAVVTGQLGFIPDAVSAAVQAHSYLAFRPRSSRARDHDLRRVSVDL